MDFGSINWLAVLIATLVSFVSAFFWFSERAFFPMWWTAMGKRPDQNPGDGQNMGLAFGLTTLGTLLQAVTLALVVGAVATTADINVGVGITTGLVIGFAAAFASLGHRLFAGQGLKVWLIEVGNDVINFVLMGAVYSLFY